MPDHVSPVNQSATLMIVALLAFGLRPSFSSCESRCEQSIPSLSKLRALWTRSFKRVGENRISFEQFLLSLVQASDYDDWNIRRLRGSILKIIGRYQDCVMACEHQFSKRDSQDIDRTRTLEALPKSTLPSAQLRLRHFLFSRTLVFSTIARQISHVTRD
ncbi:uncharacterized protein LOC106066607 [Biomphalaria glabrata]|uniref:Uncharacterized protein LOC106066607 n=1 Tax=Biomphalaria glabrata TaxID=6526 RepID=A0A2C9M1C6_BIOGL|nr:uncharacterized protein LOC106066607 [Biomphalaria glabrata]